MRALRGVGWIVVAMAMALGGGVAIAQPGGGAQRAGEGGPNWDMFLFMRGVLDVEGKVMACRDPKAFVKNGKCVRDGLKLEIQGDPVRVSVQELLDLRTQSLGGVRKRAVLVGIGPVPWRRGDTDEFVAYYKVVVDAK